MTPDERDARLTAYALNDPSLTDADRTAVETRLRTDPTARAAIEETRKLAQLLTTSLVAEQAALSADAVVTIPSAHAKKPDADRIGWKPFIAVGVLLVAFGGLYLASNPFKDKAPTMAANTNGEADVPVSGRENIGRDSTKKMQMSAGREPPAGMGGAATASLPPPPVLTRHGGESGGPTAADPLGPATTAPSSGAGGSGFQGGVVGGKGGFQGGFGGGGAGFQGGGGFGGGGFGGRPAGPGGPGMGVPAGATPAAPAIPGGPGGGGSPPGGGLATGGVPGRPVPNDPRGPGTPGSPGEAPGQPQFEPVAHPDIPNRFGATEATGNDRFKGLIENPFTKVEGLAALSTFGIDVDTASYAIVRKYLTMGQFPPANAVRLEELVNYFPYADKAPEGDNPFAVTVELAECPWQPKHRLARIGVKAKPIATDKRPPSNLVFLIDVSGSMNEPNKLPLVKESLKMLVRQLGENDRVAMVVYAGNAGLVLDSTSATKKETILSALDRLEAGGSTNGEGGIHQAYAVAAANFIKNGTNRVILCTDGDWNVGTTGTTDLVKMIEEKRKTGVFLSVFGFGMGNLRDEMMVQLAGKGNGNYGYIDTLKEANKALAEQLSGTLVTVAKDVKIQVEFNPGVVKAYRLLGYEKRALAAKDFRDDTKDAGEMGAGHVVTALYELVPTGVAAPAAAKGEELRYQPNPEPAAPAPAVGGVKAKESFVVKMRHKKPDSDTSTERELPVTDPGKGYAEASEDFRFAAAVASFAMLLRDSQYKGQATFALTQELAEAAKKHDPSGYRAEFLELVRLAKNLSGKQ